MHRKFIAMTPMSFEETLASIAIIVRAVAHELTQEEAVIFRGNVAAELRQLVTASRPSGGHAAGRILAHVAEDLEIDHEEAKRRGLLVLEALQSGMGAWDDLRFGGLLTVFRREIAAVPVERAVA